MSADALLPQAAASSGTDDGEAHWRSNGLGAPCKTLPPDCLRDVRQCKEFCASPCVSSLIFSH
eukprot:7390972-Prymnesium_polylepis.2